MCQSLPSYTADILLPVYNCLFSAAGCNVYTVNDTLKYYMEDDGVVGVRRLRLTRSEEVAWSMSLFAFFVNLFYSLSFSLILSHSLSLSLSFSLSLSIIFLICYSSQVLQLLHYSNSFSLFLS